jgi:hypothetical protein|tara:strand:- start:32549 stop:32758 length:210 start_codon:yes stop_codon:yes gene_type:complete
MRTSHKYVHYFLYFGSNVYKPQNIEQTKGNKENQEPETASLTEMQRFKTQQNNNILPSLFNLRQGLIFE